MDVEAAKRAAGEAAARLIDDGSRVGIGSGSTAHWFTVALGARVRSGLRVTAVATSEASARLAADHGVPLVDLGSGGLDVAVDGADAVDPKLRLIKGGGGAMVREKIVAAAARRFIVIVDPSKLCEALRGDLPVELIPFGAAHSVHLLESTGGRYRLREGAEGRTARSDNGNLLADGTYDAIADPDGLAAQIDAIPGVVGHGLFLNLTDLVIVGHPDGHVEQLEPTSAVGA